MRAATCYILILLAAMAAGAAAAGDRIEISAEIDKQSAYIGDLLQYTITITYDSTIRLTPPAVGANLGGFDVKDYDVGSEQRLKDGRRQQRMRFGIRTFTTGDYVIPPLPVEYLMADSTVKYIASDPIKIVIKSILAEGAQADTLKPKPLKGQLSLAQSHTARNIIIISLVVLGIIAAYIIRRRRRRIMPAEIIDPRPAHEIAFEALAMLRERDLPGLGEVRLFYFELSEIMRAYLGKQFGFAALDMTTEEIDDMITTRGIGPDLRLEIMTFLGQADLVKFAKYLPPPGRPDQDWQAAYELVGKTRELVLTVPSDIPTEPEPAATAEAALATEGDPMLKYAPPELRERMAAKSGEDSA